MLQDGPRLPVSLAALQLECGGYATDLTELSSGGRWLDAAAKPVLTVKSDAVCFSLVRLASGLYAERLPAGFSALEMHTASITIQCSVAPSRLRMPTMEEVAREVVQLFADAPASYRRFSLRWHDIFPVIIHLADPGSRLRDRQGPFASVGNKALAQHMRGWAVVHNMSIVVVEEPPAPYVLGGTTTIVLHRLA